MRLFQLLLILFVLIVDTAFSDDTATGEKWGTLTGQILMEGALPITVSGDESLVIDAASKGIANVVVYLRSRPDAIHPDFDPPQKTPNENQGQNSEGAQKYDQIEIEIRNGRFVPHMCVVRTGVSIHLVSYDLATGSRPVT